MASHEKLSSGLQAIVLGLKKYLLNRVFCVAFISGRVRGIDMIRYNFLISKSKKKTSHEKVQTSQIFVSNALFDDFTAIANIAKIYLLPCFCNERFRRARPKSCRPGICRFFRAVERNYRICRYLNGKSETRSMILVRFGQACQLRATKSQGCSLFVNIIITLSPYI